MKRVLITTSSFGKIDDAPLRRLDEAGYAYALNPHGRKLTEDEARELLAKGYVGLIAGVEPLTRDVLAGAPGLKVISRVGTGMDSVDKGAAKDLGIAVFNTPNAHVDAVAEITLGGILAVFRNIAETDRAVRDGKWYRPMGQLLRGKTVGLVGLGRVGRRLAELLNPFHVILVAYDPIPDEAAAEARGIDLIAFDILIETADVISLHAPYSAANRYLIDTARIGRMKPGAVVINASRGGLVDEQALVQALREGRLGGAYLDSFEQEPYTGDLATLPNVILTPHIGGYAAEARVSMEMEAVTNLLDGLSGGE